MQKQIPACALVRRTLVLLCALLLVGTLASFSLASTSVEQSLRTAVVHLEQHEYALALEILHDAESRFTDTLRVEQLLAVAYLGLGFQHMRAGEFVLARDSFVEGRYYAADDVRLWKGEGLAWYRQGRYAEAISAFEQAVGIEPENGEMHLLLGKSYYADGRMPEALDALATASEYGDAEQVRPLREKVQREWLLEQEMEQEVRGHFLLSFVDGEQASGLAPSIIEALEDAYAELGAALAYYPEVTVPVLLYTSADFSNVTASPDWAGAVYDGKIRLPLGNVEQMTPAFKALLYHEYAHVMVHFLSNRRAPVWLNEGVAELAGRRLYDPGLAELQAAVQEDSLLSWEVMSQSFSRLDRGQVSLAYQQSYSLVSFMVDRYGWHKARELLQELSSGREWTLVVGEVYRDYSLDWPAILGEWQASLGRG